MTEDYQLGNRTLRDLDKKGRSKYSEPSYHRGFHGTKDTELVVGSIFGIRGWDRDRLGRLVPVTYRENGTFAPGVNVANCHGKDIREHNMFECSCGYYGYFSESKSESQHGSIGGIIEATGVTTIGSEGFRAEKAELKALIYRSNKKNGNRQFGDTSATTRMPRWVRWVTKWMLPSAEATLNHRRWDRSNWRYGEGLGGSFALIAVAASCAVTFAFMGLFENPAWFFAFTASVLLGLFGAVNYLWGSALYFPSHTSSKVIFKYYLRGSEYEPRLTKKPIVKSERDEGDPEDPFSVARLRVLYPDVPIFYSVADAIREFPLTQVSEFKRPDPPLPSPLNTDNFWSISDSTR